MSPAAHISNLYLFAKDTDAAESIRGYKFQELRALQIWLYNNVNNVNERVYLDYEEDVFQRNLEDYSATFTQLKLYSSRNFSFASSEVKKAITHFFILFTKGDYLFDTTKFVFETNNEVARVHTDNDAELLREWSEITSDLSGDLLNRCVAKLKQIVGEYIDGRFTELAAGVDPSADLLTAKSTFDTLPNETWIAFTKAIQWKFSGTAPEEVIQTTINSCLALIKSLPFPIKSDEDTMVFDKLRGVISDTIINQNAIERFVDNNKLNVALQFLGDADDRSYNHSYEAWKDVTNIAVFSFGDFYNVLFASKHCRRNSHLAPHTELWLSLLNKFLLLELPPICRQETIYELVWLTLRPTIASLPNNSIGALDSLIREYFGNINSYEEPRSLEDMLSLVSIVGTCSKYQLTNIPYSEVEGYINSLELRLQNLISTTININYKCSYYEELSFLKFNRNVWTQTENPLDSSVAELNNILPLLPQARTYALSHLGTRIESMINMMHALGADPNQLEVFSDNLLPLVTQREGDYSAARMQINRGITCLKTKDISKIGKALDYFHKAKTLYFTDDTYEGFILALMNISQLYSAIGMQFSAKYYAYASIWYASNNGNPNLLKKISDSFGLVFHYDFMAGAWMSALDSFSIYVARRSELISTEISEQNEMELKSMMEISIVLAITPLISTQLAHYIQHEKTQMGGFYTEFLEPVVLECNSEYERSGITRLLNNKLDHGPINDLGPNREISWTALGCLWEVEFTNDYIGNSIGEEFCALSQIFQTEIVLRAINLQIEPAYIKIKILHGASRAPEETEEGSNIWNIYVPVLTLTGAREVGEHYTAITSTFWTILRCQSPLSSKECLLIFGRLFNGSLRDRALLGNSYQNIFRTIVPEDRFNSSRRNQFTSEITPIEIRSRDFFE